VAGRKEKSFGEHYLLGLRSSTKHNTPAYGFSIAAGAGVAAIMRIHGAPTLLDIFLFIAGTSLGFAVVTLASTRLFRIEMPAEPPVVVALGGSLSVISISAATGTAIGLAYVCSGWLAWLIPSLAFTLVYLLLVGLEIGIAAKIHPRGARSD
jgi:hypothetical protein